MGHFTFLWFKTININSDLSEQNYKEAVCASIGSEELERDVEFEVVGEAPDKAPPPQTNQEEVNSITNGNKDSAQPSTSSKGQQRRRTYCSVTPHLDVNL